MQIKSHDPVRDAITDALEARAEDLVADFSRILQFETVSGGTPEQEAKYRAQIPACFDWLKALAARLGFTFRSWEGKVAEIEWALPPAAGEGTRPVFGIASHIDVVTPAGSWTYPPFSGTIADGQVWGRGCQDDKGPLICALYGVHAAKEAGIRPPCDVRIIIGTSEETGDWSDIELYLAQRGAPDYCFTPDADFPIINGEKGMINITFTSKWAKVVPNAETHMEFMNFSGGVRSNIVPSLAEVKLRFPVESKHEVMKELVRETTRFTVENRGSNVTLMPDDEKSAHLGYYQALVSFVGKAAHGSTPEKGHNAINDALKFFADIETMPPSVRAFIQFLAMAGSEHDGSNLQIASEHDHIGATTINLAIVTIDQESGSAIVNIRPTMGMTCDEVIRRCTLSAQTFTEATGLEIEVKSDSHAADAIFLDPNSATIGPFLQSLKNAYTAVTGLEGKAVAIGGTTYAKAFPNCCAFGPVLIGVDEELAHQADERFAISSIKRNAIIYGLSVALMGRE